MSSNLSRSAGPVAVTDCTIPFQDYADLLRLLLPSIQRIGFYDQSSRARWMSDGIEAPELGLHVAKLLLQASGSIRDSSTTKDGSGLTHVVVVRAPDDSIKGAIALVLSRRKFGRRGTKLRAHDIEAACAPIARIAGRSWGASEDFAETKLSSVQNPPPRIQRDTFVGAAARATSAPVLLRRALSNAMNASPCAFGAFIAAERQFTMVQRGTDSQAQSEMREIADGLRQPIAARLHSHHDALILGPSPSSLMAEFKIVACPIRNTAGQLAAILVLFRRHHERDFEAADCVSLQSITARLAAHVLQELVPFTPERGLASAVSETVVSTPIGNVVARTAPSEPTMEQRLRTALREDGFDLHAQSLASLRHASSTARYEVLLRLREANALQLPGIFFDAAETGGLLPEIDRWVVGRLLKVVRPHLDALHDGRWEFALNVSAASLQRQSFGDFIETQLFRSTVPPQSLVFEFSEHDVLAHRPMFENLAPRLAALGCRVALDNCRQGLDIFLSIADLPVHRLKIDAALTQHLTSDTRAARAVRELVEVASDIGVETVGEHVEDDATCEMLRELGIDFAQGFKVSHPQPLLQLLS